MSVLTQMQIDKLRKNYVDHLYLFPICAMPDLLDMAEQLLALEWANETYPDPHCDNCPMYVLGKCPLSDPNLLERGNNKTWCQDEVYQRRAEWLNAYKERGAEFS